jgi:iron complex transport system permease protein
VILSTGRAAQRSASVPAVGFVLVAGLVVTALAGMLVGSVAVDFGDLWHMVAVKTGLSNDPEQLTDNVLWAIRLPRVLTAFVAGAALGAAGVGLQGAFRNPIADPHLLGVAPAAGLGAVAGIALTPAGGSPLLMFVGAAVGASALALLMRVISVNTLEPGRLVLVGLALGLAVLAVLGAVVLAWDSPRVPTFNFWIFGGLSGATWDKLGIGILVATIGIVGVLWFGRSLDILSLGESEAQHLGIPVSRVRFAVLVAVGLAVGAAVGLSGVVGFVGLVVPLVLRSIVGPAHRALAGLSALGGAMVLAAIDVAARSIAAPIEIPVGLLTAAAGAPVLVWFLLRRSA